MKIIPAPKELLDFMGRITGLATNGDFVGVAAIEDDKLLAMVGFDKWTHNAVRIHMYVTPGVIPPRLLVSEAFKFAFTTKGILIGEIASSNTKSLRMAEFFGFKKVGKIEDGFDINDDLIIMQLRREWLEERV